MSRKRHRRPLLAPEVIQTSWMDCGPACLKSMLEGAGIHAHYARLRELCQTDVDGTSIDVLEEIGTRLGLPLRQLLLPSDYLLDDASWFLPCIVVSRLPNGNQHFIVLWRRMLGFVQVMDPVGGRRFSTLAAVRSELHIHDHAIDAETWWHLAASEFFAGPLRRRLSQLGFRGDAASLVERALADRTGHAIALLDAAARMTAMIVSAGGMRRGAEAVRYIETLLQDAKVHRDAALEAIPSSCWFARADDASMFMLRGAVVLCPDPEPAEHEAGSAPQHMGDEALAALVEKPTPVLMQLLGLLRQDGWPAFAVVLIASAMLAAGLFTETILMRASFDVARDLPQIDQRTGAVLAMLSFIFLLPSLEALSLGGILRIGRHLEVRFRMALFQKLPRLGDRYFQSRLSSDVAERAHQLHVLRMMPSRVLLFIEALFELTAALVALHWLDPRSFARGALAAGITIAVFFVLARPRIMETDFRLRNQAGALCRYYLDSLLGIVPVRTHGAEQAIRREHDALLVDWTKTADELRRLVVALRAFELLVGMGTLISVVYRFVEDGNDHRRVLLLVFWGLVLFDATTQILRFGVAYPGYHNAALRAFEPLGARDHDPPLSTQDPRVQRELRQLGGIHASIRDVTVALAGSEILSGLDLEIRPGEHVAVVGRSGSGKSTLVGLFLGFAEVTHGRMEVNGMQATPELIQQLRRVTAWVDPTIQLWNSSVLTNLLYGSSLEEGSPGLKTATYESDLLHVLESLPQGMQTVVGQSGGFVSGGEGQRVRLARAMLRHEAKLVLLDEPFRGLARPRRSELLKRCRKLWSSATLLCVTHDIAETLHFDRVLVMDGGRLVEDGNPKDLAERPGSVFRTLLDAEEAVRDEIWSDARWRKLTVRGGHVIEKEAGA